jgi:hypothetical protein
MEGINIPRNRAASTPAELAEFGSVLHRLVPAIKAATEVAQQPPLTASYSAAEAMSRQIRERFEQS